jgi:hypothetical protein
MTHEALKRSATVQKLAAGQHGRREDKFRTGKDADGHRLGVGGRGEVALKTTAGAASTYREHRTRK